MVAVAQLVEPQIVVLVVAGSSPVGHPIFNLRVKVLLNTKPVKKKKALSYHLVIIIKNFFFH